MRKTARGLCARFMACALAAIVASGLMLPATAFAEVRVDQTVLVQGDNAVGGGVATLTDTALNMVGVVADSMTVDQNLDINFNGGNDIEVLTIAGSADVTTSFTGENSVEDIVAQDNANLTINADGHDDIEEVTVKNNANVTVNVTGQNEFEEIAGYDNASITIRGTSCQRGDIVNVSDDDEAFVRVFGTGTLTIDHVTLNLKGTNNELSAKNGNLVIDTSKVSADDGAWTAIYAGGTMRIFESVIDITGQIVSGDLMTIEHSDVKVAKGTAPEGAALADLPYRVFSYTGIELIREKNGEVLTGEVDGKKVWYVDTDDNDGKEVDLLADGVPAYYSCKSLPGTGDFGNPWGLVALAMAGAATAGCASRRLVEKSEN